ncbi:hypothetical protein CEXT_387101 [Caerostris extrusa]|uniref:Uncharacterized protein n=1 Tax=Caerostris extrusa TaxID=172846 RepID=A0AAV4P6L9_CAEEX|nr:hypothetical protein CEXT_387101 [Caerostris extrusa]
MHAHTWPSLPTITCSTTPISQRSLDFLGPSTRTISPDLRFRSDEGLVKLKCSGRPLSRPGSKNWEGVRQRGSPNIRFIRYWPVV